MTCPVERNCKNYIYRRDKCWACVDFGDYLPEDRRILSPRQVEQKRERKERKKEMKYSEASKRGKKSKRKGYSGENEVERTLQKYGIDAKRVPLSGALKSEKYGADVELPDGGKIEVKRFKSGLKKVYDALNQDDYTDYLFARADRQEWVVCMDLGQFVDLWKEANDNE